METRHDITDENPDFYGIHPDEVRIDPYIYE